METKAAIRKAILNIRNGMGQEKRREYDRAIRERLLIDEDFIHAKKILLYISFGSEVDTHELGEFCLQQGKQVYCPKVLGRGRMEFYRIRTLKKLQEGHFNIPEPPDNEPLIDDGRYEDMLMLMPLVAFDEGGNRLGYGGGFYDRYLSNKPGLNTIALAYEEQCFTAKLPTEMTDIKPKRILTPKRVLS